MHRTKGGERIFGLSDKPEAFIAMEIAHVSQQYLSVAPPQILHTVIRPHVLHEGIDAHALLHRTSLGLLLGNYIPARLDGASLSLAPAYLCLLTS